MHVYRHRGSISLSEGQRGRYHQKEFEEFQHSTIRFSRLYPDSTASKLLTHCIGSTDIEEGRASSKLVELTKRHNADALILGAKNHAGLIRRLFGQVSQRLIYSRMCPVLIVPEGCKSGYPNRAGALCSDSRDEEYLKDWTTTTELLKGIETTIFMFESFPDLRTPITYAGYRHILPPDGDKMIEKMEEVDVDVDLCVILLSAEAGGDRKTLIHFLYDHLNVPLLCIPEKT